ncbi:flagellar biosynthesis regulator FlaF [Komagataeibacter sp. FNDCR2]|uniref:flagellar biosynthesis regulator FlaF n=1 Tax=Komagataeibacter sp. FNDCR2 TaxID=2878682 RepID=UPI001E649CFE|nr:flagellar biosynthesis regulator FlaF [Komagataeibacter sp. FNDCR2]MCE2576829.1 flagellar biosynthesis regulator FlaF [Komagataeibacter sp. FNDCR2]
MMIHPAMKAYQSIAQFSLTGREADAACFRMLIDELEAAASSPDQNVRRKALSKHQNLWSMIMKANTLDTGVVSLEDRELFVALADKAQKYGILATLHPQLSLSPLIQIAQDILEGLESAPAESEPVFGTDTMF